MHRDSSAMDTARRYLGGQSFEFATLYGLWQDLKNELEFGYARQVLAQLRTDRPVAEGGLITDGNGPNSRERDKMCQQHALCTSKDTDLSTAVRHDDALSILGQSFDLRLDEPLADDQEALGIAGGILKRRWEAFGQIEDLSRSLRYYQHGYEQGFGDYGYTAINAAFVNDLLASLGDHAEERRQTAHRIRQEILDTVDPMKDEDDNEWLKSEWWYYVTLAEACLGLGDTGAAVKWIHEGLSVEKTPYWEFETTARQFVALSELQPEETRAAAASVIEALLQGADTDVGAVRAGKVGLALSGGGLRASLYHIGVLARLAELDVLRRIDVLSCVSGGSIVGAMYYLAVRSLLMEKASDQISRDDYVDLVRGMIEAFRDGMRGGVRDAEPGKLRAAWRLLTDQGAMDTRKVGEKFEEVFYKRYVPGVEELWLDEINLEPKDHDPDWKKQGPFNPKRHNWRRRHKVPSLILNATTMNTGHCWQFTTASMGETPFSLHEDVDSVPRLRRAWYRTPSNGDMGRRVRLGQAVGASAAVPGIFEPIRLVGIYPQDGDPYDVRLVDGGVYDNQGIHGLIAHDCNVVIVSDAAGQLKAENDPPDGLLRGTPAFAGRAMLVLMERIRQSGFADLQARLRSKLLRGVMFIHMKQGLDAEPIGWVGSQESYQPPKRSPLTPSGVRRDFQLALAELRTDLDDFNEEADYLIACGYQMTRQGFAASLAALEGFAGSGDPVEWPFDDALKLITNPKEEQVAERAEKLAMLERGAQVTLRQRDAGA